MIMMINNFPVVDAMKASSLSLTRTSATPEVAQCESAPIALNGDGGRGGSHRSDQSNARAVSAPHGLIEKERKRERERERERDREVKTKLCR